MIIEISITVRGVEAPDKTATKVAVWDKLRAEISTRRLLNGLGIRSFDDFWKVAKVYREVNGTYTVVIP